MEHSALVCMLDGSIRYGTVRTSVETRELGDERVQVTNEEQVYFDSSDGKQSSLIDMDSVKAIFLGDESKLDQHASLRFFDSVPIPFSLWVRAALVGGEIVEGMLENTWRSFTGAVLELHLPGSRSDSKRVLIPRTSIAQLQVITTR